MDCVQELYADKDLSLLKKLTLVIPTHNRNFYLSRCLWYHAHFPFAEIIVADSSIEEKRIVNRETVNKIREAFDTKITYLEYDFPAEKYGGEIYRKWGDAVQQVKTEYSQSCTDKEFLIPTTVCNCIIFLDEHQDYSIAEGMDYTIQYSHKNTLAFYPWQGTNSYINEDAIERIYDSLSDIRPVGTQFSVHRSKHHKKIFENITKYNLYDLRFGEANIELSPLVFGKTCKLHTSGNIRDTTFFKTQSIVSKVNISESSCKRYPIIPDYPNHRYEEMFRNLQSSLTSELPLSYYLTDTNMNKETDKIINIFLSKRYHYKLGLLNKHKKTQILVQRTWDALPMSFQEMIRTVLGEQIITQSPKPEKIVTDEIKCIEQLILANRSKYDLDTPII